MLEDPTETSFAPDQVSEQRRVTIEIWLVASLSFLLKTVLALRTYGTNDVYAYEQFSEWSQVLGAGLYRAAWDFNHPPSMIHLLRLMGWLSRTTGIFFPFWLRLPAILADAGSLGIVWILFAPLRRERSIRWTLMLLAASPALVLVSGFHGNTDSLMIFFLLLAVYFTEEVDKDLLAGAAFGLALCVKIVPVIAAPIMFFYRSDFRRRLRFFIAAGGVMLVAWSPFLFEDPAYILGQVFRYHGYYGHWGFSWIATWLAPYDARLNSGFRSSGAFLLLALIGFVSFRMNRSARKPSLYSQMGIVFFLFLAGSNAFGVQYLAWLPPWTIGLATVPVAFHALAGASFLFLVYDFWSQGMPWYLADSNRMGDFQGRLDYFQLLCWLSVLWLLLAAVEKVRGPLRPVRGRLSFLRRPVVTAALIGGIVGVPFTIALSREGGQPAPSEKAQLSAIRAAKKVELSAWLNQIGRTRDSVDMARQAARQSGGRQSAKEIEAAKRSAPEDEAVVESTLMNAGLDALYSRRDYGAAISAFRDVLSRSPTHYGANFQMAVALDAAGRHPEAVPYWKTVLRIARSVGDKATGDTAAQRLGADAFPK